jgi:phosphoribosylanthranilate isomerase
MNIKVCGLTDIRQFHQLEGLDIEYGGIVFYKESSRWAGQKISGAELKKADLDIRKVGVFVDPEMIDVLDAIDEFGLDVVQLHGNESPQMCEDLSAEVEVIKAFRIGVDSRVDVDRMVQAYDAVCDYYLFDTFGQKEMFGGNDRHFNWDVLKNSKIEKPFFLGGGIGPDDAGKIIAFSHPDFFGVDLGEKFEKEPGVKDMAAILKFRQELKAK